MHAAIENVVGASRNEIYRLIMRVFPIQIVEGYFIQF